MDSDVGNSSWRTDQHEAAGRHPGSGVRRNRVRVPDGYNPPKGPKRPKMVTCDCCPCFGRKKRKHAKDGLPEGADVGEFQTKHNCC
jgi:hypothetical protein